MFKRYKMIEKDWRFTQDDHGNFVISYRNPNNGEWNIVKIIKKPTYNKKGKMKKNKCSIQ